MAAASGAPTIGLFGPTDAATYGPSGPRAVAVVAPTMAAITTEQVVTAARHLLDQVRIADGSASSGPATASPAVSS